MHSALYLIAILGCGEGDLPCEEIRLAEARYESRAECVAATAEEVVRHTDILYPVVVAQCRSANAAGEPVPADAIDLPEPEDNPYYRPAGLRS